MQKNITKGIVKTKSHKEDEDYRGRIRELEKENRSLRKRLKTLERNRRIWEQFNLDSDENLPKEEEFKPTPGCPKCTTGSLILLDLGIKRLWSCTSCGFRKVDTSGQS